MNRLLLGLALALSGCGESIVPSGTDDPLGPNEVRVRGRITSASALVAVPVQLSLPTPEDPLGLNRILDDTTSGAIDGRYELRAQADPTLCQGAFLVVLYDAFDRFVGKHVFGCGDHVENFNIGPGVVVPH